MEQKSPTVLGVKCSCPRLELTDRGEQAVCSQSAPGLLSGVGGALQPSLCRPCGIAANDRVPQSPFLVPILVSFLWEMKQLLALRNSI